jgi:hypothetical protein
MSYKITKKNTVIIIDWDDTLFPTSWVTQNKINLNNHKSIDKYIQYFEQLDRSLIKLLNKILCYGKIIIITNALLEWIKISSVIIPNTYLLLKKIKIVSARQKYQKYSSDPMIWKKNAFKYEINMEIQNNLFINVLSIGDALYEYNALVNLKNLNTPKLLKSIKFLKSPSHDKLIDQLNVLYNVIEYVCKNPNHLDLQFDNL